MSPFANALKDRHDRRGCSRSSSNASCRAILFSTTPSAARATSRAIRLASGLSILRTAKTIGALDVQWQFHDLAQRHLRERDPETDWLLETLEFCSRINRANPQALIGGVDWITKKMVARNFHGFGKSRLGRSLAAKFGSRISQHRSDARLVLQRHARQTRRRWNNSFQPATATRVPPANTRASGRARAVAYFQDRHQPYVINWDSIAHDSRDFWSWAIPSKPTTPKSTQFSRSRARSTNQDEHE